MIRPEIMLFWSLLGGCTGWSCASPRSFQGKQNLTSRIDLNHRLQALQTASSQEGATSPGVSAYQRLLRPVLGSHCSLFPSDSANAQILASKCGAGIATLRAMSRFYLEPDASGMGSIPLIERDISGDERLIYEDLPQDCALF